MPKPPRRVLLIAALLTLYLVWGSTYLGIAVAVQTMPPFFMAAVRFAIAGLVLLVWCAARDGRSFTGPTRREWRDSLVVGALLLGGGMGMVAYGEQTIPSGIAALLIALMPVWVAIFGRAFLGERLPTVAIIGIVVGFAGVVLLVGPSMVGAPDALDPAGLFAIILSPIAWAAGSLFAAHRATLPPRPLVATGAQMLTGSLVLGIMSVVGGEPGRLDPGSFSQESIVALAYLTLIGSLLAFTAYGWLLRVAPLPLIATYAYVNPVVALILGAVVLQEPIGIRVVVAGGIIVGAVALIITARGRLRPPRPRPGPSPASGISVATDAPSSRPAVAVQPGR